MGFELIFSPSPFNKTCIMLKLLNSKVYYKIDVKNVTINNAILVTGHPLCYSSGSLQILYDTFMLRQHDDLERLKVVFQLP